MKSVSKFAIAMVAGMAMSAGAYAQKGNVGTTTGTKAVKTRSALQKMSGHKIEPVSVAGIHRISAGRYVLTTPWMPYHAGHGDTASVPAFDCFEADASGAPTGFCDGACSVNCTGTEQPGFRWWYGTGYLNPDPTNDMTVVSGAAGLQSTRAEIAWAWGPTVATQCYVLLTTAEDFNDCGGTATGASNFYDGVVLNFGPLSGAGGYFYSDVDLSTGSLFWQLPMDGTGAYQYAFGQNFDATTGQFTLDTTLGTQPMLWGTGDGEVPPDGRVGHQGPNQWDDDNPTDGMYDATECYDYTAGLCPDPLGAMVLFYVDSLGGGSTCYANCDLSTTVPFLNVNDFLCFQSQFAAGNSYANCDNSTTPPVLNVNDFLCFQSRFAAGCSAP